MARKYHIEIIDGSKYEGYLHDSGEIEDIISEGIVPLARIESKLHHIVNMGVYMDTFSLNSFEMTKVV